MAFPADNIKKANSKIKPSNYSLASVASTTALGPARKSKRFPRKRSQELLLAASDSAGGEQPPSSAVFGDISGMYANHSDMRNMNSLVSVSASASDFALSTKSGGVPSTILRRKNTEENEHAIAQMILSSGESGHSAHSSATGLSPLNTGNVRKSVLTNAVLNITLPDSSYHKLSQTDVAVGCGSNNSARGGGYSDPINVNRVSVSASASLLSNKAASDSER